MAGEELILDFGQTVTLGIVEFQNGGHNESYTGQMTLGVFNAGWVYTAGIALTDFFNFNETGSMFSFLNTSAASGQNGDEFYIQSLNAEVLVPAALFLFAQALLGFYGLRRKAALAA